MTFFILVLLVVPVSAQNIFHTDNQAYQSNNYKFILLNDSTCFIRGYDSNDFSKYALYTGELRQVNDLDYELFLNPVVQFGCNKRLHWKQDSVIFRVKHYDLTQFPMNFDVSIGNRNVQKVSINKEHTTVCLKGTGQDDFILNTGFLDPLNQKEIKMTIKPHSNPDLMYYEKHPPKYSYKLKVSIVANKLTIFPDKKLIWKEESFTKIE